MPAPPRREYQHVLFQSVHRGIQSRHKHSTWATDCFLNNDTTDCLDAMSQAEAWVMDRLRSGEAIVDGPFGPEDFTDPD